MQSLPWLLVRAPLVWPLVLGAIVAFAIIVAFARSRRDAARAARSARDRMGRADAEMAQPCDGTRVTLIGTIEVEGAPCQRFEDGSEAAVASAAYRPAGRRSAWITGFGVRADRIALSVGDTKIALEGPVEVLAGSRETQRREPLRRMPQAVRDRVAAGFLEGSLRFVDHVMALRSIARGDVVRASGVLRRDASETEGSGYRTAVDRWKLVPDDDARRPAIDAEHRGLAVAFEGSARLEGPRSSWYVKHAAASAAVGLAVLSLGGEIAFAVAKQQQKTQPNSAAALCAASLAAITPWRREAVLRSLANAMDVNHEEDATLIERRAAIHQLSGDHRAAAEALARHGFLDRGADLANDHGEHLLAAQLFYASGHFERASLALQRFQASRSMPNPHELSDAESRFAVRVHLLAGHPDLAAKSAHELYESRRSRLEKKPEEAKGAALAYCLHYALDQRSDSPKLHVSPTPSDGKPLGPACAVLLADLLQGKERLALIRGFTDSHRDKRQAPIRWLKLLEQEADSGGAPDAVPLDATGNPSFLVINPTFAVHAMIPGLERALAEAPPKDVAFPERNRATRASAAALAATFAASTGDYESARRLARIATDNATLDDEIYPPARGCVMFLGGSTEDPFDSAPDRGAFTRARAAALSAAIELSRGAVAQASELLAAAKTIVPSRGTGELDALIRYRSERNLELESSFTTWHIFEKEMDRPLSMAAEGDGAALAAWLRKPTSDAGSLLRLGTPLLQTGKEELTRWIRLGYRVPLWSRSTSAQAVYWSDLAGVATALGDEAQAGVFRDRASRFRTALLRRDLAVPLAVVEEL